MLNTKADVEQRWHIKDRIIGKCECKCEGKTLTGDMEVEKGRMRLTYIVLTEPPITSVACQP